jgi:hypothetical protein
MNLFFSKLIYGICFVMLGVVFIGVGTGVL